MEVDIDNRYQKLVHALFVRSVGVQLAPKEKDVGEQFEYGLLLEKLHLLVSAVDVLLDLLQQKRVRILYPPQNTVSFFSAFAKFFISGFFGIGLGDYLTSGFLGPLRDYSFKVAHRFLDLYSAVCFSGQLPLPGKTSSSILQTLNRGTAWVLAWWMRENSSWLLAAD